MKSETKYITSKDAMSALNVKTVSTINDMIKRGTLRAVKIKNKWNIDESSVQECVERQKIPGPIWADVANY